MSILEGLMVLQRLILEHIHLEQYCGLERTDSGHFVTSVTI